MLCKVCNTRIHNGRSSCPNCGSHSLSASPAGESNAAKKLPNFARKIDPDASREARPEVVELDEPAAVEAEVDMALNEATAMETREEDDVEIDEPGAGDDDREAKEDPPQAAPPNEAAGFGTPDAASVRRMLALRPGILEPGLEVYRNERGTPLGAGYTSAVGEIDLLARDSAGGLVVVMVAEPHEGPDLISAALERIGWVRKHLGGGGKRVRGIVLMDRPRDTIAYAAAAVADTVSFRIYRVSLTFDDLAY
jgi:predicted  nucleic acid-binding Zn-ribbon protein